MTDSIISLTKSEWENKYKPISNPLYLSRISFGPAEEEIALLQSYEAKYIWTQLWDFYQELDVLLPGMYPPDESGQDIYYVTERAWDDERIRVFFPYE
jgi:hypothetical protein